MSLHYRPEIDGLRAVAVLSVVFYHAGFQLNSQTLVEGGFLGVDVFFVLSGYLITRIILKGLKNEKFSFTHFYERRARRILPALFFVLCASLPWAWSALYPREMKDYAASVLASLFFGANFWFWQEDSYTADPSALKPFLHTWSLSLEEQFYLVFPLVLVLLWFKAKHFIPWFLGFGVVLSFIAAIHIGSESQDASFFLLPFRAWELLAAAGLAFVEEILGRRRLSSAFINSLLCSSGIVLVMQAMIFGQDTMAHPGWRTLPPVLGTMLILWFASKEQLMTRLLSSKPLVGLGLISYSLYLWHVPIFAFLRIGSPHDLTLSQKLFTLGASLLLAIFSYFYIEKPFRRAEIARKKILLAQALSFAVLSTAMSALYLSDGATFRYSKETQVAIEHFRDPEYRALRSVRGGHNLRSKERSRLCSLRSPLEACRFGDGSWVSLGDSHVGHYEAALLEELRERGLGLQTMSFEACPLVSEDIYFSKAPECSVVNAQRWARIQGFSTPHTFVVASDSLAFKKGLTQELTGGQRLPIDEAVVLSSYQDSIKRLLKAGHRVILIFETPRPHTDAARQFLEDMETGHAGGVKYIDAANEYRWVLAQDKKLAIDEHPNLVKVFPREVLCEVGEDRPCVLIGKEGSLYNRGRHLSRFGARRVIKEIFRLVDAH